MNPGSTRRIPPLGLALALGLWAVLPTTGAAQTPTVAPTAPERPGTVLSLDQDGRLLIGLEGSDEAPTPIFERLAENLQNGGATGFLSLAITGRGDFLSTIHAPTFLARLGLDAPEALERTIRAGLSEDAPAWQRHLGAIAARHAAAEALAIEGAGSAAYRPLGPRDLAPLAEALDAIPANATVLGVAHQDRLPPNHLGRAGELIGRAITEAAILGSGQAIDDVPPFAWLSTDRLAIGPAVFPFEWTRRVGNFRIQRSLMAFLPAAEGLAVWIRHEGTFDADRWAQELDGPFFEVRRIETGQNDDDQSNDDGFVATAKMEARPVGLRIDGSTDAITLVATLSDPGTEFSERGLGAARAQSLAERIDLDACVTLIPLTTLPDDLEVPPGFVPKSVVLRASDDPARAHEMSVEWTANAKAHVDVLEPLLTDYLGSLTAAGISMARDGVKLRLQADVSDWLDREQLWPIIELLGR